MEHADKEFTTEAQEAFRRFVERVEAGGEADFEGLCRAHPELARELCELRGRWEELREKHPCSGSRVSLQGRTDLGFAAALLERLGAHGNSSRRYRAQGEIAKGGQGVVLRVWDEDLGRPLAMKVLQGKGASPSALHTPPQEARSLGRFLEEALVTGQLDHPGIVPVHELGLDSAGRVYFTMKLVKGRTLQEIFDLVGQGDGTWNRTRALSILLKVCEATAYAHAKGVIHRDLKPANVMVGRYGEVYVMDWGLARVLGQDDGKDVRIRSPDAVSEAVRSERHAEASLDSPLITMDGDVVGTPSYMSPEQALGRLDEVGPHSDVYSLGAMLYHLLAGHAPYIEPGMRVSNHGIWYQVQKGPPTALHERAPDTPAELLAICDKAMARAWRSRYVDTSELAEDLAAFLEHRVVHAYQTGAVAELRKWVVRNKGLASALAAGLLVLVIGLATSLVLKALAESRLDKLVQLSQLQDREDLLARVDGLWPARPENIDGYRSWIDGARALVDDLPMHRARRSELRRHALPLTEAERAAQRLSHPDYPEFARLAGEIACKRRALAQRRDGVRAGLPEVDWSTYPADASRLKALAWERVDPGRERFGEEPLGLALAQRAREAAPEDADVARVEAWAHFALGRDEDALEAGFAALEAAPEKRKAELDAELARLDAAVSKASSEAEIRRNADELPALEARRAALEGRVSERHDWRFPESEPEARWWNNQLTKLIEGLEGLAAELLAEDAISPAHGWSVPKRLGFALRLGEGFAPEGRYAQAWRAALPAIRGRHPGLDLAPQLGLVPIGADPRSGLWEFAHLETGEVPARDAQGELVLTEQTGLVFVLLPGGTFAMGAQARDPAGANYDPQAAPDEAPVHDVTLSAFLLAKFEMTQGQWSRFTGSNPSFHPPGTIPGGQGTLRHPVEMVSWNDAVQTLVRLGLVLPTEAQWEYAARAGTSTPWWTGARRDSLAPTVNLADQAMRRAGSPFFTPDDWPGLDDGCAVHAPVDAFRPNPFGLHNVHGNVFEWCRDGSASYESPAGEGDGERLGSRLHRMYRGGAFTDIAAHARSSSRSGDVPEYCSDALGLRPARAIDR